MVSNCGPKIHQKSLKIHPETFWGSFECICVPLDHQNGAKMVPRNSKLSQNGDPRTLKEDKKSTISNDKSCNSASFIAILEILPILLIFSDCKSAVNWLPEGPAAGAKP